MLKKKHLLFFLIIVISFSMTSCINFIEHVLFHKNGSGTYTASIDMSKLGDMIKSLGDDADAETGLGEMNNEFKKASRKIEAQEGVTNVRTDFDEESFKMSISFDFQDIDALNRGMSAYYHDSERDGNEVQQHIFFTKGRKSITRTSYSKLTEALTEALKEDGEVTMDPAVLLGDMYFQLEMSFEGGIKSVSNNEYSQGTGAQKNSLTWRKYIFKESDANKNMEVTVRTRK